MKPVRLEIRDFYYRIAATSKLAFAVNSLNVAARGYQAFFAVFLGTLKYTGKVATGYQFWFFVVSLIYTSIHSILPKGIATTRKWIHDDVSRTKSLAIAISELSDAVNPTSLDPVRKDRFCHRLLHAMQSEIEKMVLDTMGLYINVNLLVLDPNNPECLMVINRANLDRPVNVSYPKENMLVWSAMESGRYEYRPDVNIEDKPYHCILAYPLLLEESNRTVRALGGISIDSARSHHFDGWEAEIETKLVPYLSLLRLVLR